MKDNIRLIKVKESIHDDNNRQAKELRETLRHRSTLLINLMSSPGSGKTSLLLRTIRSLKQDFRFGVIEADIDSTVDAELINECGVPAVQLQTGGFCHVDSTMVKEGLDLLDLDELDIIFIENVGNLVCPAEFDTGASADIMILSVPEGDDKPLKYPLMFSKCQALIVNKTDYLQNELTNFNLDLLEQRVRKINQDIKIFPLSSLTGKGFNPWCEWLSSRFAGHTA